MSDSIGAPVPSYQVKVHASAPAALHLRRALLGRGVRGVDGAQQRPRPPVERDSEDTVVRVAVQEREPGAVRAEQRAEREPSDERTADCSTSARDTETELAPLGRQESEAAWPRGAGRALRPVCSAAGARNRSDHAHGQNRAASRHPARPRGGTGGWRVRSIVAHRRTRAAASWTHTLCPLRRVQPDEPISSRRFMPDPRGTDPRGRRVEPRATAGRSPALLESRGRAQPASVSEALRAVRNASSRSSALCAPETP